ncbi:hypothetical protein ILYODFUR_014621 [Ilyodon furcidens]|uniref:Uncharacterized protein n=1 Tax=Ilyodon furcidens TaxID=33524 RepID=A0ABV0UUZ5_9TELE
MAAEEQGQKAKTLAGVCSLWSAHSAEFPVLPQDLAPCMIGLAHLSWSVFHLLFIPSTSWHVSMETTVEKREGGCNLQTLRRRDGRRG